MTLLSNKMPNHVFPQSELEPIDRASLAASDTAFDWESMLEKFDWKTVEEYKVGENMLLLCVIWWSDKI